jgi:hypothetical protein
MSHFVESFAFCLPGLMSHCFMSALSLFELSLHVWSRVMFGFESCYVSILFEVCVMSV